MSTIYRKEKLLLLLAFTVIISSAGCDDAERKRELIAPAPEPFQGISTDSMPSNLDIIIDATPSMVGFAEGAMYRSLVAQDLANASVEGATTKYHRLSTDAPSGIEEVDDKVKVTRKSFYRSGNTKLERAIDMVSSDRLVVLVSDLFQTDADMNQVANGLARSVLQKDMAIGLFGVRLPFDGVIYDIGFDKRSFPYEGRRPLYGLVLGNSEAVSRYFKNLRRFVSPSGYHFLMLGSRLSNQSGTLQNTDSTENLAQVAPKGIPQTSENRYLSVSIVDNTQRSSIETSLKTDVLDDLKPLVNASKIEADVTEVQKYREEEGEYTSKFQSAEEARAFLETEVKSDDKGQNLQAEINSQKLRRGNYCFNLVLGIDQWSLPQWVQDWNLPPSQYQNKQPDGNKTANLRNLLLTLSNKTNEVRTPQLATLQVFVEKSR